MVYFASIPTERFSLEDFEAMPCWPQKGGGWWRRLIMGRWIVGHGGGEITYRNAVRPVVRVKAGRAPQRCAECGSCGMVHYCSNKRCP